MADTLTVGQLEGFKNLLAEGKVSEFYTIMRSNNYHYAGWAQGVADGDTIAGMAAIDYLSDSAKKMMGGIGPEASSLSVEQVNTIKAEMAQAYLDTLIEAGKVEGGSISRDVTARETWNFHKMVFERNDLTIENWTMHAPFTIIEATDGADGLERFWEGLRDTAGEGPIAFLENLSVMTKMMAYGWIFSNGPYEAMAEDWLDAVGFEGAINSFILGTLSELTDLFDTSEEVLLSRTMVEIFVDKLAVPSDAQQAHTLSIASLVNNPETARGYIDAIRELIFGVGTEETPRNDLNALMTNVAAVMNDSNLARTVQIESLARASIGELVDAAQASIAYRYALLNLNPFVLIGDDALYVPHNANGELDLYDDGSQTGTLSEQWLHDRAALLRVVATRNAQDNTTGQVFDARALAGQVTFFEFVDPVTGEATVLSTLVSAEPNLPEQHILFGGSGADELQARVRHQRLRALVSNSGIQSRCIPWQQGVWQRPRRLDSRLRGNDEKKVSGLQWKMP